MPRGCLVGRPYLRDTCEAQLSPSCPDSSHSSMCKSHESLHRMLSCEIPAKTLQSSIASVFTLSLYHTTLTVKSHNKYKVQKIEQNYNQIWYEIKANKTHSCKSQLYNIYMMYVVLHLSLHVLFLFSIYTHVSLCMQSLFLFHTKTP